MHRKFLFIVGGVMSGVGKGTSAAALGLTLKAKGYRVTAIKVDPYVNVDAGTMNPVEHGEVFVTKDGDETDQDIGTYERFLGVDIGKANYMTTGRVYRSVIERERNLEYGGKCVEVVPHVPEEVITRIKTAAEEADAEITLVEVGGTVGEYQNLLFLEAARMMHVDTPDDVGFALVSYLPVPPSIGEMKTKPTQYAVRTLNGTGIQPDFVICRSTLELDQPRKEKISRFCSVAWNHVISAPDAKSIYHIPELFEQQQLAELVLKHFGLSPRQNDLSEWRAFTNKITEAKTSVKIGVIGKYFSTGKFVLSDAYLSVLEAIKHAAAYQGVKPEIHWLNAETYEEKPEQVSELSAYDGILIPGGFGSRGIEGKIKAIQYVREQQIPYFGLCYGMQCVVIEYARNVLGWSDAHTQEIDAQTAHPVIHLMEGQETVIRDKTYGGTMRLGEYACAVTPGTVAHTAYGAERVMERHRHRYEFNNAYWAELESAGLVVSGVNPEKNLVEMVEIQNHPFFIGVQFHPEFLSRPLRPHPLFMKFLEVAAKRHR
ncbi:MAG: CTP synthase [bacterium]|nr:CTP synthase [bacterium]